MPDDLLGDPIAAVRRLDKRLDTRRPRLQEWDDYYVGEHPLAFASQRFLDAFGGLFEEFADNWCELVVDGVEERLDVTGFRFGGGAPLEGEDQEVEEVQAADQDAWRIWQANELDAESQVAHTEAIKSGICYVLVWFDPDRPEIPSITIEDPQQMVVAYEAGNRRRRVAALKRWQEDDGREMATLYRADGIYKFQGPRRSIGSAAPSWVTKWGQREVAGEAWPLPNPMGVVPVVPLVNQPRLRPRRDGNQLLTFEGDSEIRQVIPIQDGVNKLVADMLIASEFGAFRQRWATGLEIPKDPETGEALEPFKAAIERLWIAKKEGAKFGEFEQTDLRIFVAAIEMLIQHIASRTRTPPHYFYLKGEFPSGESIKSAETGLVAKARRKMRHFGERWEEVMRLGFLVLGDPRAQVVDAETIWGDPESRTEGEHIDAVVKRGTLGIPQEQLWEDAGYSPQQIGRFKRMRAEEQLELAAGFDFDQGGGTGEPEGAGQPA